MLRDISDRDREFAYREWRVKYYGHADADDLVGAFLSTPATKGWLRKAREALYISQQRTADTLGISRKAYRELEQNEFRGNITLKTLQRCAEALDCELVYAVRPKTKKSFAKIIWEPLYEEAKPRPIHNPYQIIGRTLAKMFNPAFRRKMKWRKNWQPEAFEDVRCWNATRRIRNLQTPISD